VREFCIEELDEGWHNLLLQCTGNFRLPVFKDENGLVWKKREKDGIIENIK